MRVPRFAAAAVLLVLATALAPVVQAAPWSDTFTVAEPRAGDSGLYSPGAIVVDGEATGTAGMGFAFELDDRTTLEDAYGAQRDAWPFRSYVTTGEQALEIPIATWVHARAEAPLLRQVELPGGYTGPGSPSLVREEVFGSRHEDPHGPECLFLTGVQGATLQEGIQLPLADVCGQDLARLADRENASVSIEVAEVVTLESGGDAVRLVLAAEHDYGTLEADLWYKEDIPYPIEINLVVDVTAAAPEPPDQNTTTQPEPPGLPLLDELAPLLGGHTDTPSASDGFAVNASIELERFHRGQGPVVPGEPGTDWPDRHEDLSFLQDTRWGPTDGGPSFRYPHAEAVEALTSDPTLIEFQDWRDRHPDAAAVVAEYGEEVNDSERRSTWTFLLAAPDGSAWQATSTRTEEVRGGQGPSLEPPASPARNDAERVELANQTVDLDGVPDRLPSLSSLIDRWAHRDRPTADNRTANHFRWVHEPLGPWSTDARGLEVGWREPDDGQGPQPPSSSVNESLLQVHPDDGAAVTLDRTQAAFPSFSVGGPPGGSVAWPGMAFQGASAEPAALDAPTVVGIATASTLLLIVLVLVKLGVSFPLYSRLDREDLLDQPTRRAVYEVLDETEGRSLDELAEAADCSPSTARYHLQRLEDGGLVASAGIQAGHRWFATGSLSPEQMERRAALEVGNSQEVYDQLVDDPGASLSEVADAIGSSPPAVHQIVERLEEADLVEKHRDGRQVALYPADGSLAVSTGEADA